MQKKEAGAAGSREWRQGRAAKAGCEEGTPGEQIEGEADRLSQAARGAVCLQGKAGQPPRRV